MAMAVLKPFFLFIYILLLSHYSGSSLVAGFVRSGNETDHLALLAIKAAITNDPFGALNSWNESIHFCHWLGVTCSRQHQRVTVLSLQHQQLTGSVSPHVGNLSFLRELSLGNNSLTREIPLEVGCLRRLRILTLTNNLITGVIPSSISSCSNLVALELSGNKLTGKIPSELGSLTKLGRLMMERNNITGGLPSTLGNLSSLTFLFASYNSITGNIPDTLGGCKNLEVLSLGANMLVGTFPFSIYNLTSMINIFVPYNKIEGRLQSLVFKLPALEHLQLNDNKLTGNLPEFQSPSLEYISGTIPESNRRNSLKTINLNGNGFEGPIPKSLVNCTNLEVLDLGRNNFFDKFPHWLGNLPYLHILILHSNEFHGSIVTSTPKSPFPMLRVIDISNNRFTGPLPTEYFKSFEAMKNVDENFHLEYMISGYYYDSLTIVMKGSTVKMIRILKVFSAIDLSSNKFEGEIPEIIGGLNSIRGLNLSHNNLTGHIPESVGNMMKLEWLDLSSNKLTGEIPPQLTNLNFLGTLNLSQNHLTGPIPRGKQFDTFSNDSYSNNSALCGPPLSNACGTDPKATQPPPSTMEEEDSEPGSWFSWEVILPGYGFGLVVGLVVGYLMFSFGKPQWLVKMVESAGNRYGNGQKRYIRSLGSRRN